MAPSTDLFPIPTSVPGAQPPVPEATTALRSVLWDNHTRWHIFHNDRGFHNHVAHRALALWALNASGERIREAYASDNAYQRPFHASPAPITEGNVFEEHLGDRQYYASYLMFFESAVRDLGFAGAIERYIFARAGEGKAISMLDRFLGGLLHAMTHVGYGLEFGLAGMVVEGLAQAAVHDDVVCAGIPDVFFSPGELTELQSKSVHIFTVLARILHDPDLQTIGDTSEEGMYGWTMRNHGASVMKHMADWIFDASDPREVGRKIEELCWGNTLLFGVGGRTGEGFNADFFTMHLVTSSLFLHSYIKHLIPPSQVRLLRAYLLVSLTWYIARGRPALDIMRFYSATSSSITSSCPSSIHEWSAFLTSSTLHPDDHLPKLQRALEHYARVYGERCGFQVGDADEDGGIDIEGVETLDGTLFLRVARLVEGRLGREGTWDRCGFYE
ncbi:hypothetical protein DXG01_009408 [Tephrocybe rancida]|nr:hypothetical protein DXG01_009408 [Tephrocybe rancida]